ncbi:MAG: hypothetical protein ACP5QO_14670 [Clostridia bacterium]
MSPSLTAPHPLATLGLALAMMAAAAAVVLVWPLRVELSIATTSSGTTVTADLLCFGQRFQRRFEATTAHLDGQGGSRRAFKRSQIDAVWHGFSIYRRLVLAVAGAGEMREVSLEGRLGLRDPARTAVAVGLVQGMLAARLAGVPVAVVDLTPEWRGAALTGRARGIFRWRGVDIMVAVMRTLRSLGMLGRL